MENQEKNILSCIKFLKIEKEISLKRLIDDFMQLLFDSIYINTPKQFSLYLHDELENFLSFLETGDTQIPQLAGKHAFSKGLTKHIIFPFIKKVQAFIRENIDFDKEIISIINDLSIDYLDFYTTSLRQEENEKKNKSHAQLYNAVNNLIEVQRQKIITLQKQTIEQRLKFLIDFSHDIRHPLMVIENGVVMIKEELHAGKFPPPALSIVEDETKDLKNMIVNIMDNEKILLKKELYSHDSILNISKDIVNKIRSYKFMTNLKIQTDIEPDLYTCISPTAFKRVYTNIIGNAIKFTKEGSIDISLKSTDTMIHFIIKDTGMGIRPETLSHLFDSYFRKKQQFGNDLEGIGAGLPVVKGIIDEVGGTIKIKSRKGGGTTVYITFKKAVITEKNKEKIAEDVIFTEPVKQQGFTLFPDTYSKDKKTVFVVDDSRKFQKLLQYSFAKEYNVYCADNGKDALHKIQLIKKPDIIFSDIIMPVMDGWTFLKKIRKINKFQDIPFLFLTAKSTRADKIKGFKVGAVQYIYKPCSIEELKEVANSLISAYEISRVREKERTIQDLGEILDRKRKAENSFESFDSKCDELQLSKREKEVLLLALRGMDNKSISDLLCIDICTAKAHISHIYRKTRMKKRGELIAFFSEVASHSYAF